MVFNYSGCVVPSFLHRVYNRCTHQEDISHHIQFLKNILQYRDQNMPIIHSKIRHFHAARKQGALVPRSSKPNYRTVVSVTYDNVSKVHKYSQECISQAYNVIGEPCPRIVHSSLPKLGSRISTKRCVLGKVKLLMKN